MTTNAAPEAAPGVSRCERCGATFECGVLAGSDKCWCFDLPKLGPLPAEFSRCLCPDCLKTFIRKVDTA